MTIGEGMKPFSKDNRGHDIFCGQLFEHYDTKFCTYVLMRFEHFSTKRKG